MRIGNGRSGLQAAMAASANAIGRTAQMRRSIMFIRLLFICVALLLCLTAVSLTLIGEAMHLVVPSLIAAILIVFVMFRYTFDPDRLRARQSQSILLLAAQTLPFMRQGLSIDTTQSVCELLLPATLANAVAITNREIIMGYAGAEKKIHPPGSPIMTRATLLALKDGCMRVITSQDDIGFPQRSTSLQAAIIVPLTVQDVPAGVLKFYYRSRERIDETQQALAQGFGMLLEMQLQLADLEYQREQATQMSLKALQAQINPHFLFNTINTIASFIRTDPPRARILLREFAVFYRQTLEGSLDLITLQRELYQTLRYFGFEVARFGPERLRLDYQIDDALQDILVPAFIIQPLVENSVAHAMRDDRQLRISVEATEERGDLLITVTDDGLGMGSDEKRQMFDKDREHASVALRNVNDRLKGYFGIDAGLDVQSDLGLGTTVVLNCGPVSKMKVVDDDQSDNSR
jgi:two-component system sensor histidine kinase LytS